VGLERTNKAGAAIERDAVIDQEGDGLALATLGAPSRVATFLLTDVVGSTRLWDTEPVAMGASLARHDQLVAATVARNGGVLVKARGEGDSTFSVFTRASDAVLAAASLQQELQRGPWPAGIELRVRMAVHTGEAVERDGDFFGGTVNRVARLRALASGWEVLVSEATARLTMAEMPAGYSLVDCGSHVLRDLSRPENIFAVAGPGLVVTLAEASWSSAVGADDRNWPPGPPVGLRQPGTVGFVGRVAEIRRILALGGGTATGQRATVLVSGEPGIGKTRFAYEATRLLHRDGAALLYGRCDEDATSPYQPFLQALGTLASALPGEVLVEHAQRHGGELARLVPELSVRLPGVSIPGPRDPDSDRYLLFRAMVDLLAAASELAPVVIVLDDLHWADRPSIALLRYLATWPAAIRLLIIALFRDAASDQLTDLAGVLRREPNVERIDLGGLSGGEVGELVRLAAGRDLDDSALDFVRWLHRDTDGNPFFVGEMLRDLRETGTLYELDGHWRLRSDLGSLPVPSSVRDVIRSRLVRLGSRIRPLVDVAAVVGGDVEFDVLAAVLDEGDSDLIVLLHEAERASFLAESDGGRFRFVHALIGKTVYDDMGSTVRSLLHRRVAVAIERLAGDDRRSRAAELCRHWANGHRPEDAGRAVDYALLAAGSAQESSAPDEAARWYALALELLDRAGRGDRERCRVLVALGEAQRQAGDRRFRESLLEGAALAQRLGDGPLLVEAALANNRGFQSASGAVDVERVAVLEAALAVVPQDDPASRARLLAILGNELCYAGDPQRRTALSNEAVTLARAIGDQAVLAAVLIQRQLAIMSPATLPARLEESLECVELADTVGDPVIRFWAAVIRFCTLVDAGDLSAADEWRRRFDRLAHELRQPLLQWAAAWISVPGEILAGRLSEAERLASEALRIGRDSGQPDAQSIYVSGLFSVRFEQGRLGELEPGLSAGFDRRPAPAGRLFVVALTWSEMGRLDEAAELLGPDVEEAVRAIPADPLWLSRAAMAAEVCVRLRHRGGAGVLYGLLAPWEGQTASNAATTFGLVGRHLGSLAALLGEPGRADDHFAAAAAAAERAGAPIELARTRLAWAESLVRRPPPSQAGAAREMLAAASAAAEGLGCATISSRAASLLEELDG